MKSTLLIATILAATLTSASALPAAAAKPRPDLYHINTCETYLQHYLDQRRKMREATTRADRVAARDEANWAINKGFAHGCDWVNNIA